METSRNNEIVLLDLEIKRITIYVIIQKTAAVCSVISEQYYKPQCVNSGVYYRH